MRSSLLTVICPKDGLDIAGSNGFPSQTIIPIAELRGVRQVEELYPE
jgi:hypothetical protein